MQVLLDLPVKSDVILYTGLSAMQKKLYKAILTKDTGEGGTLREAIVTIAHILQLLSERLAVRPV